MTCAEVTVWLGNPPQVAFTEATPSVGNYVRLGLSPRVATALGARAKRPGTGMMGQQPERSVVEQPQQGQDGRMGDCERLLGDATADDAMLFARQDVVEAAWAIMDPSTRRNEAASTSSPSSPSPAARASATISVELTRFGGHPIVGAERRVHDAEESSAVPTGISGAHHRAGPQGAEA